MVLFSFGVLKCGGIMWILVILSFLVMFISKLIELSYFFGVMVCRIIFVGWLFCFVMYVFFVLWVFSNVVVFILILFFSSLLLMSVVGIIFNRLCFRV